MLRVSGIILGFSMIIFLSRTAPAALAPVDFYSFNGSLNDSGTAGYNLSPGPAGVSYSTNVPPGFTGESLSLNGGGQFAFAVPTSTVNGSFTLDAWVYCNPSTSNDLAFFGTRNPSECSFDVKFGLAGVGGWGPAVGLHADIGTGADWIVSNADYEFAWQTNTWYNVAYVIRGGDYSIYLNGAEVGRGTLNYKIPLLYDANHYITVGDFGYLSSATAGYPGPEYFNGLIDNLAIYNSALTQSEVQSLVPEPASSGLIGLGCALGLLVRRRRTA